jgi:hypothetical protein
MTLTTTAPIAASPTRVTRRPGTLTVLRWELTKLAEAALRAQPSASILRKRNLFRDQMNFLSAWSTSRAGGRNLAVRESLG